MKIFNLGINILFCFCAKPLVGAHSYMSKYLFLSRIFPSSSGLLLWNLDSSSAKTEFWVSWHLDSEQQSPEPLSSSLNSVCWRTSKKHPQIDLFQEICSQTWHITGIQSKLKEQVDDFRDFTSNSEPEIRTCQHFWRLEQLKMFSWRTHTEPVTECAVIKQALKSWEQVLTSRNHSRASNNWEFEVTTLSTYSSTSGHKTRTVCPLNSHANT